MDDIDAYIAAATPTAQPALRRIRAIVREAAPHAQEIISYRMPAFRGRGVLIYFGAFKDHIGVFPPIRAEGDLAVALAPYLGPKGNLRFPLDAPLPDQLIEGLVRLRVSQDAAKGPARTRKKSA